MLQAVIFDMDGVLIDSEPLWQDAELEVFRALGVPLTREMCLQTMGLRIDEVVAHWAARHPWPDVPRADVAQRILDRVCALIAARGEAKAGVHDAVAAVRGRGLKLAIASSSPHQVITTVLARLALSAHFPVIHSAQDEPLGKPHPGVYLTAAARLGVPAVACVAVEDSLNGVIAAKAARMTCIAVPDPALAGDLRLAIADVTLGSLCELDDALLARLGA